jgi:hypothetical protein
MINKLHISFKQATNQKHMLNSNILLLVKACLKACQKKQVQFDHPPAPTHLKHFISTTHNPSPTLASYARCE